MIKDKFKKIFKIIIAMLLLIIIVVLLIKLAPFITELFSEEGQIMFKNKLDKLGVFSIVLLFLIQVAQIFLFIIPGEPIEILAGMCYGEIGGTVFILLSSAIISLAILGLVRKHGKKSLYKVLSDKKISKIKNSKLLNNPKKIEMIMFILFLIPGTPKDLLVYIAGLLPIKPIRFVIISSLARSPSTLASTFGGKKLLEGNWQMTLLINTIVFLVAIIIVYIYNKIDKDKTTEEALKTIE